MYLGGNRDSDTIQNAYEQLRGRVTYVAYPPPNSPDVLRYASKCDQTRALTKGDRNVVFVGQIPRLLPVPYVPWAIDLLLQEYATAWVLQTHANGCAKAWTEAEAQAQQLVLRSKQLIFDVCGVWVARGVAELEASMAFQRQLQVNRTLVADPRVARQGMILERLRPPKSVTNAAAAAATEDAPCSKAPLPHPPFPPSKLFGHPAQPQPY
jgi:hypothetical protein